MSLGDCYTADDCNYYFYYTATTKELGAENPLRRRTAAQRRNTILALISLSICKFRVEAYYTRL